MRDSIEAGHRVHLRRLPQPAMLGFEAKDAALVHDDENHNQNLMVIHTEVSSARGGRRAVAKNAQRG
jgi:hypothetical protein